MPLNQVNLQTDGETPLLLFLLWSGVVVSVRVSFMSQMDLFENY